MASDSSMDTALKEADRTSKKAEVFVWIGLILCVGIAVIWPFFWVLDTLWLNAVVAGMTLGMVATGTTGWMISRKADRMYKELDSGDSVK